MAVPSSGLPFFLELAGDPPLLVRVRREEQHDLPGVRDVILAAMRPLEAAIVDALRVGGKVSLALVADLDDRIVGQVLFGPMSFDDRPPASSALCLGPLAVHPDYQNRGIGSVLTRAGLDEGRRLGYGGVLLYGHLAYFPRFGFRPASAFGILSPHPLETPNAFQAIELVPGVLRGSVASREKLRSST